MELAGYRGSLRATVKSVACSRSSDFAGGGLPDDCRESMADDVHAARRSYTSMRGKVRAQSYASQ